MTIYNVLRVSVLGFAVSLAIGSSSIAAPPARCPEPTRLAHGECVMPVYPKMGQLQNWAIARNPDNPFDATGLQHNAVVADFILSDQGKQLHADLLAGHPQSLDTYFVSYFQLPPHHCKPWWPTCWPWPFPWPGGNGPYDPGSLLDFAKTVDSPDDWVGLNPDPTPAYLRELEIIEKAEKNLFATGDFGPMIALEARIAASRKFSELDRKYLLKTASVARYSFALWTDPNNGWADLGRGSQAPGKKHTVKWDRTAVVDAIVGGLTTPAGGALGSIADIVAQKLGF